MHRGIHLIKIHFAVILYVLGNACYIFNSSNKIFLQIHFTRIIDVHFFKNNVSSFSLRHKFLNTLKNIDIEINVLLFFFKIISELLFIVIPREYFP